ncbi:anti-sigma factor [Microlunatus spumicola]|uniref:Regulator of SigK n=1 Tax=Microlunatus spumicola TaxID=81499 RepID=A0ABP6YH66_9ACTN
MNEIHDLAAAYALDALDPTEQQEFELHLAGCADCRAEVAEFGEVASDLVLTASAPPPPPELRAAILAAVVGVEQLPPAPGRPRRAMPASAQEESEDGPDAVPVPALSPARATADPVDELAVRRANRRARVLSVLVAAVSVLALALGGVVYSLARQPEAPVAGPPATQAPEVDPSLLAAPDAEILPTTLSNGAQVSFVVSKSQNRAAFVSTDLPLPGAGNEYHLWTLKGDTVVRPDSTLPGGANQTQLFTGPVADSTALAVNIEPAGSDPAAPTTPVLGAVKI